MPAMPPKPGGEVELLDAPRIRNESVLARHPKEPVAMIQMIDTPYGRIDVDPNGLRLGELLVTDEGAELEVVELAPLRFELAPEEDEDWGE